MGFGIEVGQPKFRKNARRTTPEALAHIFLHFGVVAFNQSGPLSARAPGRDRLAGFTPFPFPTGERDSAESIEPVRRSIYPSPSRTAHPHAGFDRIRAQPAGP